MTKLRPREKKSEKLGVNFPIMHSLKKKRYVKRAYRGRILTEKDMGMEKSTGAATTPGRESLHKKIQAKKNDNES